LQRLNQFRHIVYTTHILDTANQNMHALMHKSSS